MAAIAVTILRRAESSEKRTGGEEIVGVEGVTGDSDGQRHEFLAIDKGQTGLRRPALHGFVKKTRTTPDEDMALVRKRQKELQR